MVRPALPHRVLGLWIAVLLLGAVVGAVTLEPEREVALVVSDADGPAARGTTTLPATTTSTEVAPTTTAPAPVSTTATTARPAVAPTTTTPRPTTTTTLPGHRLTMTPAGALSSSSGAHYTLAGAGCTAERVVLRVYGGTFQGDMADVATVAPDGSWGIGFMVHPAGSYELRAECAHDDGSVAFTYASVPFTILP